MDMLRWVLAFLMFSSLGACKTSRSFVSKPINGKQIYYSINSSDDKVIKEMRRYGIQEVYWIPTKVIDTDGDLLFDKQSVLKYLLKMIPSSSYDSHIILDWEGKNLNALKKLDKQSKKVREEMISLINYVKSLYPKSIVGYYGLPFRDYWNRDEMWKTRNTSVLPIIEAADALYPSIYDFYQDATKKSDGWTRDQRYVRDNVKEALRLADGLQKGVFPMVWNRYHDSNKKVGSEHIPPREFEDHIKAAFCQEYNGSAVNGVIWWSSENYFVKRLKTQNRSSVQYDLTEYLDAILNAAQSSCKTIDEI